MSRIILVCIVAVMALIGLNIYMITTAKADEISRYMQEQPATDHWADYIYQHQSGSRHISQATAERIAKAVVIASSNYDIAPDVIVGLMKTESGFDPSARSRSGALGLMQVVPYWHKKTIQGRDLFNIEAAVDIGVAILAGYRTQSKGSLAGGLRRYCGYRPKAATQYVAKVMTEHRKAFKSVVLAQLQSPESSPVLTDTAQPVTVALAKPEANTLDVSTATKQKLAALSGFETLASAQPNTALPLQARVYLTDPFADLSILPEKAKQTAPSNRFLDFGDLFRLRWS